MQHITVKHNISKLYSNDATRAQTNAILSIKSVILTHSRGEEGSCLTLPSLILSLVYIREGVTRVLPGPTLDLMHKRFVESYSRGGTQGQPGTA